MMICYSSYDLHYASYFHYIIFYFAKLTVLAVHMLSNI